ncbi:thrombospondin type 3 repeat-containing protein, partial [Myxococcota bacterium]|nr:thrombospondin type 3 repeat-containing protein [Myxococcota bacterium]
DHDGRIDGLADQDGDGIADAADDSSATYGAIIPTDADTDGDSIPNPYDPDDETPANGDSNGNGITDDVECGPRAWPACTDTDGDGAPDFAERVDHDGDGVLDAFDLDADGDGIPNVDEGLTRLDPYADADHDGIPNALDPTDRGDGRAQSCLDANGDGLCERASAEADVDGDGVPNHLDLDSDGDGVPDVYEAAKSPFDADHDGIVDGDVGANGLADVLEATPDAGPASAARLDTDGDGIPDALDLDSDGDGLFDVEEVAALSSLDADHDGRVDTAGAND